MHWFQWSLGRLIEATFKSLYMNPHPDFSRTPAFVQRKNSKMDRNWRNRRRWWKIILSGRELNPGLLGDRRGYLPLYYQRFLLKKDKIENWNIYRQKKFETIANSKDYYWTTYSQTKHQWCLFCFNFSCVYNMQYVLFYICSGT